MEDLFLIKKNQLIMMEKRDFVIGKNEKWISNATLEQFESYVNSARRTDILDANYIRDNDIAVAMYLPSEATSTGVAAVNKIKDKIAELESYIDPITKLRTFRNITIVCVVQFKFSKTSSQDIRNIRLSKENIGIEVFLYSQLLIIPTSNENTGTYKLLNEQEKAALLSKYKVSVNQLPIINTSDAIVHFMGYPAGSVLAIQRDERGVSNGINFSYRIVVDDS